MWRVWLLLPLACGPSPDFVTGLGAKVFLQGHSAYTARDANLAETALVGGLEPDGFTRADSVRCMGFVELYIFDFEEIASRDQIASRDPKTRPAGYQYDNILHVGDLGCVSASAWVHEEAHWLQQCVLGVYDPGHSQSRVWELVAGLAAPCDSNL
jgi:hypothetical protein